VISQRAWLIGGVGFCFYLIAIVNTLPSFYYALTWLAAGVLASSLGIALLSLVGLLCAWQTPRSVVSSTLDDESSSASPVVEVQMANTGTLNKMGVIIEVDLLRQSDAARPAERQTVPSQRFLLEALPTGQSLATQLPLFHLPRGRYEVAQLRLIGSDVLGLFRISKRVPPNLRFDATANLVSSAAGDAGPGGKDSCAIIVGPPTVAPTESLTLQLAAAGGEGGAPATRFLGHGDELRGTRLYAPGDDLRYVHWRSTARRGQLVVKEFHHTQQTRVLVVWDGAAGFVAGERDGDFNTLEWSLCLAASICRAMEERHQPCALLRLDSQPLHLGAGESTPRAPNGALSNAALSRAQVAEALAAARADRTTSLAEAMSAALPMMGHSGSTRAAEMPAELFLVTASLAPDTAHAVAGWCAAGGHVCVALLNGAAFEKNPGKPGKEHSASTQRAAVAMTNENFETQLQSLRAAGARVVGIEPQEQANAAAVLSAALHALLHRENARNLPPPARQTSELVS
jgi:uncharacterized protein (DUF58 family)